MAIAPAFGREKPTPLAASPLADNLVLITGAGANVVAARSAASAPADGALLVDGGLEDRSAELLKLVAKQTGAHRVGTLINTHWHPEQTGSNVRLGKSGTRIVAHENTK
ncbi:MAG TPA: MBL fold metallo-hydrolase, partial [Steroidobacteraceae bacterium]|nr:MBL fold metallo-hydrolase [Steroidobacteraceae bacterium]